MVIYQKMAGRYFKFWCTSHNRMADHISINGHSNTVTVKCDRSLGGIMIPCNCVKQA